LTINRRIKDKKAEAMTLNSMANVYLGLSDFKNAIEYYDECIYVSQSVGDLKFESTVLTNKGLAYQQFGDLKASLNSFFESLSICKSADIPVHYALYNNIGIVYLEIERYEEAMTYFIEALKKATTEKNVIDESFTLANIGRTYTYMGDFSNAITYLCEAMIIMKRFGNRQAECQVYANLGKAFMKMRSYPEAIKYYNRSLKYYKEIGDLSSVSHTLCEIGELYFELNDFKTSKEFFNEGLALSKQINDVVNIVRVNTGIAKLYLKFNDTEKASELLSAAESLASSRGCYKELSRIFKIYSDTYGTNGKSREARESLDKHYSYLQKLITLEEESKLQALILGHISPDKNTNGSENGFKSKTKKKTEPAIA
jgi:tetratricopeptide (TPR) repeat protein